ncbi:hypothetical protein MicloDRAFT_00040900 [Microvirga lotononidis]|uniref:Uncharacterized protein n=1 Tax=Microvirga lotononidis TaxID=864069 RepID=I4YU80_9HYPH|nr:hypothetical protein MicloDRAFT_00040900 [Microvirga lotononidis]
MAYHARARPRLAMSKAGDHRPVTALYVELVGPVRKYLAGLLIAVTAELCKEARPRSLQLDLPKMGS